MNITQGFAVAATFVFSAGVASAADYDQGRSKSSTAGILWRNAPAEADSFAAIVGARERALAPSPGTPLEDAFETDPARRDTVDPLPPSGDMEGGDAMTVGSLIPVPEPNILTLLLAGLGVIGLIGRRRRLD